MVTIEDRTNIGDKYMMLEKVLDERARRLWAATEAQSLGYGGISAVAEQTGLARTDKEIVSDTVSGPNPAKERSG